MKLFSIKNMLRPAALMLLILILGMTQVYADNAFAPSVSVKFLNTVDGAIPARPVSVKFLNTVDGAIPARPVSVKFLSTVDGVIPARPVGVVFNGFLGLWHMDNNWQDSSDNANNGTAYGSAGFDPSGKADIAGSFNGTSAYVDFGSSLILRPAHAVTIEAWIRITPGSTGSMYIAGNTDETTMTGYGLIVQADGTVAFKIGDGSWHTVVSATILTQGLWYHIAGTYDGNKLKLYINGLLNYETLSSGIITYKNSFRIGYRPGSAGVGYFSGLIDDLAVNNRPLSGSEILTRYQAGKIDITPPSPPAVNPVVSPTVSAIVNLSGTKEADTAIWISGTKKVQLDSALTWQANHTLTYGLNTVSVVAVDDSDNSSTPTVISIILDDKPPVISSSIPANNSDTAKVVNSVSIALNDTYSAVDLNASISNATVRNSAGQSISGTWTTSGNNSIVFTPTVPFPQDTYTVTVSPTDVLGNIGTAQIVFKNYDITPPVTTISLSGTLGNDGWYSTAVAVSLNSADGPEGAGIEKTEYSTDGTTWNTYSAPFVLTKDGITTVHYRSIDKAGNQEVARTKDVKINTSGIVGQWHMDNNWLDSSVIGSDGTPYNGATFSTNAKIGAHSGSFDGVNDYMRIPNNEVLKLSGNLSISLWTRLGTTVANLPNLFPFLIEKGNGIATDRNYGIYLYSAGNSIHFNAMKTKTPSVTAFSVAVSNISSYLDDLNWHHIAATWDGAVAKIYIDGTERGSANGTGPLYLNNFGLGIGGNGEGLSGANYSFKGLIDEVTIYNSALSAEEIQAHYQSASIVPPTVDPVTSSTSSPALALSGTKPANTAIVINGYEAVPMDDLTTWQGTYTLQSGTNTLNITAKDANAYQSQAVKLTVVFDNTAPIIQSSVPANNTGMNTQINAVTLTLSDAFSAIDLSASLNSATVKNAAGQSIPGTWTTSGNSTVIFIPASSFGEDTYTVIIYPTDILGNRTTAQISFNYDATAPPVPTVNTVTSPTKSSSQTITGTKSADTASIVVTSSTASVGTVSYPTATTWSVIVSNFLQGPNTLTAFAKDAAGNQSGSVSATIIYDITAPAVPAINTVKSPTRETSVTLTGSKEANSFLYLNNVKTAAPFADTSWSYTGNLNEGNNSFALYAKDEAGNQSQSVSVSIVRDTVPPMISTSTPSNNTSVSQAASIDVLLSDTSSAIDLQASLSGALVKDSSGTIIDGGWAVQNSHIIFTPAASLSDSVYTVTLHPVDALGNSGTVSFSFTVDTAPPVVQSNSMSPTSPHKAETVTFTLTFNKAMMTSVQPVVSFGQASPYDAYSLTGGSWNTSKIWTATFTFSPATGDGTYTVKINSAKDSLGNTLAPASIGTFVLDTLQPAQPVLNAVTSPTKTPNQTISGTKPADTAIVINNTVRVALNASTTWSYSYPLSEGQNSLSIVARDAADNDSTVLTSTIVLDTTPPAFTINSYQTPAPAATQVVSGSKEPGCIVKLNGTQIFGADDLNPSWSYTITLLQGISNHFVFTAADALGNTTTKTIDIVYDVSAPAQLATGVLVADGKGKGTEISLSWSAYVESSDIAYYRVYMSNAVFSDTTGMNSVGTTNKGVRSYKATGLTKGSTYYFGVVPVDASGNFDPRVNAASGIPTDTVPPEDVAIKTVISGYDSTNGNLITITWTGSVNSSADLADQIVYFDSGQGYDNGTSLGAAVVTYTKSGLNDATRYKFRITVKDTGGHESTGVMTEGVTRLNNPATVTAAPGNAKVSLSWTAVSSSYLKQYNVYRSTSDQQQTDVRNMTLIKTAATTVTSFTDIGMTNGTTYQYAVTALNTFGAEKTDVQSVSAKPRMDETGPVISSFSIANGQVVTAPITITASATDAESSMGRLDLFIDSVLVKSQTGSSLSYFYNAVETTDGNHTIKLSAYDQHGNVTEETRQFIVSLAAPALPAITGHTVAQTTPEYLVNLSGTAPLFTTITLRVNNQVVSTTQTTSSGTFSFSSVKLIEGDNYLSVKAAHRGGESAYSSGYRIAVDTGVPSSPVSLISQVLTGGVIRFTWQNAAGEIPSGYNLYMGSLAFTSKSSPGVTKTNSSAITYLLKEYTPSDDSLRYYAVTALDSAGNESGISNVVSVSSDRTAPSVTAIEYRYYDRNGTEIPPLTPPYQGGDGGVVVAGIGTVKVSITVSETLKELPFFSLEPTEGSPIVISMQKIDDTHYAGSFDVTALSPHGGTTYKFSGKDMIGNRGNAQGTGLRIDIHGPIVAVQSPLTLLQITASPVEVNVVFDEQSVITPAIELKSSSGATAQVTGLVSSDNGIHWTGTIDVSGLAEGNAEFILKDAKDRLGNTGTTVSSGKTILLYRDSVPPPDVPTGLAAKSGKAGLITLTWSPVAGASSYNLYRRAEAEATPVKVKSGMLGSPAQDTPPADGTYYYAITSTGLLNSESQKSAEVQALSDRTGPAAPAGLALSLSGSGVTAIWAAVSDQQSAVSYNLYRSGSQITSTSGLTPVAKVSTIQAVDTAPVQSKRFYAVTALDSLGNEGPLSETREIVFPVSPVRNLSLEKVDSAAPYITWQAPSDGTIIGYYIYRNASRITQYPVTALSYTDGYYSGGSVTYGISALNDLGNEGPIKELMLPDISMKIKEGTTLRRGLLETAVITVSNPTLAKGGEGGFVIDTVSVKAGTASESVLVGPFTLSANTTLQLEKVLSPSADASSPIAVITTASWSPSPGVSVKITKTSSAEVTGASAALEIFSDPLIRGTEVKVKLKVNNLGSGQMEFVTSENSSTTRKVKVSLKDEDGNILSTGYLDQRVGAQIVNTGSYAVARLNSGEAVLTEPITVSVPMSAPYKVLIEAAIEKTYYHYNKVDQVEAPGMRQSTETTISETAYRASATSEHDFYPNAQPVVITGSAISNQPSANGEPVPMPFVPVKVGISLRGFDRYFTVTTDANGNFAFTFTPGATEAGLYSIWAVHPDVKDRSVQSTFAIAGLNITPAYATVRMARGRTLDIPVTISNYGGGQLNGLTFNIQSSSGITSDVINQGDSILTAGENAKLTFRLTTASTMPDTGYATLTARTAEGAATRFDANISIVSAMPIINTTPSLIDTGMVRGNQKISSFVINNTGQEVLKNARIEVPSTPWMTLTVNKTLGDINPGSSISVGIMFSPSDAIPQGVYDDTIVIYSDNHMPYTYHIQVTVTSNAVGNVLFDVLNEFLDDVPNATITFQHQTLTELIYTVKTGPDGTAMQYDMPEGRYSYNISPPPGHIPFSGSFIINPGITTTVPVALEMNLVTISWSVEPVVIQDKYEIKISQIFETNVPAPVLITEPASITLPEMQPGQTFNGEFTVTNYGLIQVTDVNIAFPSSFEDYDIEVLSTTIPKTLNAMQKIAVPYRITRRIQTISLAPSPLTDYALLLEEVQGYGGSSCLTSFAMTTCGTAVICPNTPQQRTATKCTSYTVGVPKQCAGGATGGYVYSGGGGISVGGGSVTQGSGGLPQPQPAPINTSNPCNCKDEGSILPDSNSQDCQKQACINGSPRTIADDGEKPLELCKICDNGQQTNMPDGSRARIVDALCCYQGDLVPNETITFIDKCPKKTPKAPPYQSPVNGCGPQDGLDPVPDNPMWWSHLIDPAYLLLHGVPDATGHLDGDFKIPCDNHDTCYGTCNGQQGAPVITDGAYKNGCDTNIGKDIDEVCYHDYAGAYNALYLAECLTYSRIYESAVRFAGKKAFNSGQADSCNCCY